MYILLVLRLFFYLFFYLWNSVLGRKLAVEVVCGVCPAHFRRALERHGIAAHDVWMPILVTDLLSSCIDQ
jgi:hypothetical protein